jgi:hypothetical protein
MPTDGPLVDPMGTRKGKYQGSEDLEGQSTMVISLAVRPPWEREKHTLEVPLTLWS